jgi:hypothetical protein
LQKLLFQAPQALSADDAPSRQRKTQAVLSGNERTQSSDERQSAPVKLLGAAVQPIEHRETHA